MLFAVRLVSRQPHEMAAEAWQSIVAAQLKAVKGHYDQGKIRAIYRETGHGVLAIFDVADAREMDTVLAGLPMTPYFAETHVSALWDMATALQSV